MNIYKLVSTVEISSMDNAEEFKAALKEVLDKYCYEGRSKLIESSEEEV